MLKKGMLLAGSLALAVLALSGCSEGGAASSNGASPTSGSGSGSTTGTGTGTGTQKGAAQDCDRDTEICLALKVVSYDDDDGAVLSESAARQMVGDINGLWASCGIGFRLEEYRAVDPRSVGLDSTPLNMSDLPEIRGALGSRDQLLVVVTSRWGTAGNINDSGADAWTTLPGSGPYGAVIDEPVARNNTIIAHELGHYLSLLHVSDRSNLLSPIVGASSRGLTSSQCSRARSTALGTWGAMVRS